MRPGEFCGRLPGLVATDPADWPEKWDDKQAPGPDSHRIHSGNLGAAGGPYRQVYAFPARVTLTQAEREWLGATVRWTRGLVGQVWSLGCRPRHLWIVADQLFYEASVTEVEKIADRFGQPVLCPPVTSGH